MHFGCIAAGIPCGESYNSLYCAKQQLLGDVLFDGVFKI